MVIDAIFLLLYVLVLVAKWTLKVLVIGLLLLSYPLMLLNEWLFPEEPSKEEQVQRATSRATRKIDDLHRDARHAMNAAAGQSWRSLVD